MTLEFAARLDRGDFTLDVAFTAAGGVTALFGRSGAGKTTVLEIVAGLVRPRTGSVALDGATLADSATGLFLPTRRRRIGYVFQEGRLFPHLTVAQNLAYGRRAAPPAERWARLEPIVDLLGIGALLGRRPASLSGGEEQRVAIGRALLASPKLLLMDEPLASLDRTLRAGILPYLDRLRSELRIPILYVSHAVDEIARIADRVVVIEAGRVSAIGPAADILARLDLPAIAAAEPGALLSGTVTAVDRAAGMATVTIGGGALRVPAGVAEVGARVRLRIRARDVALAVGDVGRLSIRNRLAATVTALSPGAPPVVDVRLSVDGEVLLARLTAEAVADLGLAPGVAVTALVKAVALEPAA